MLSPLREQIWIDDQPGLASSIVVLINVAVPMTANPELGAAVRGAGIAERDVERVREGPKGMGFVCKVDESRSAFDWTIASCLSLPISAWTGCRPVAFRAVLPYDD